MQQWSPEVLMLTSVRHLSFSRFSPFEEGRLLEPCIGVLAILGTSTGGREGVSTCADDLLSQSYRNGHVVPYLAPSSRLMLVMVMVALL